MGERMFSKYQIGLETTRGTAVPATRVLGAAVKAVPMDRAWEAVRYADGGRATANHKRFDQLLVEDSLTWTAESPMYFQALPALLLCLLDGDVTPAEQTGGQDDYLWAFAPSLVAANAPKTLTVEMGDDTQAYEIEYVMGRRMVLAGQIAAGGPAAVTCEWEYFGRQVTPTTFTSGQALHTALTPLNAKLARLWKDTTWAGLGGTEIAAVRGFELELLAGNHPKPFGGTDKTFTTHGEASLSAMLTLDLEGGAAADAIYDEWRAGTESAVRFALAGPQIGSGDPYLLQADLFGYWAEVEPLSEDRDGNNLHRALFATKPSAAGEMLSVSVTTNHETI